MDGLGKGASTHPTLAINATCYGGGDAGHQEAVAIALGAMERCRHIIRYNTATPKYPR
ncbi:hypothetical protein [Yoonia sp. 72]|uniref:hypothetical protein n=1 Tax=unclassified Yoonia TaxID=2629118 RepID=UPI003A4C7DE6